MSVLLQTPQSSLRDAGKKRENAKVKPKDQAEKGSFCSRLSFLLKGRLWYFRGVRSQIKMLG